MFLFTLFIQDDRFYTFFHIWFQLLFLMGFLMHFPLRIFPFFIMLVFIIFLFVSFPLLVIFFKPLLNVAIILFLFKVFYTQQHPSFIVFLPFLIPMLFPSQFINVSLRAVFIALLPFELFTLMLVLLILANPLAL